jgi:hypothetical protein
VSARVDAQTSTCSAVAWTASLGAQQFLGSGATFSFTPTTQATYHVTATLSGYTAATDIAVSGPACGSPPPTGGVQHCSSASGTLGAYSWQLFTSVGCMTPFGVGAAYSAQWTNPTDFLAREGLVWNETQTYAQIGTIVADFDETKSGSGGGFSYIGVYGWSVNPLHEYYIVEDWYGNRPVAGVKQGTVALDGGTYDVYAVTEINQPSILGSNQTYVRYVDLRQTPRTCGHISITDHFNNWAALGMTLGDMEEARILVETGGGNGSITFNSAAVTVY